MIKSKTEDELMQVCKHKHFHKDRQDQLAALGRAVGGLSNADYELVTDEAAQWFELAAEALSKKQEVPEFPDAEEVTDEPEATEQEVAEGAEPNAEGEGTTAKPERKKKPKAERKAKEKKESAPKFERLPDPDYDAITGDKDRYGVVIGTKTAMAVELYEKGATSREITEKLGGKHYNILTRLAKDGHLVERLEGGVFKLTHKDDFGKQVRGNG